FKLAHADLVTMGLLDPILRQEEYLEGRVVERRTTPEIIGHQISELGAFVNEFIKDVIFTT
ncbi:hypothetical protein, partial [Leisingera sp.]|uniref:hypothetical protein n=1 Tax=Leisingera sp. TaxID=1879318 RepID=UPI002B26E3EB